MLLDRKCSGSIYSYVYSIGMKAGQVLIFTYKIPYLHVYDTYFAKFTISVKENTAGRDKNHS